MDNIEISKLKKSLDTMRSKVIEAKGKSVEGLTPLPNSKSTKKMASNKSREAKS